MNIFLRAFYKVRFGFYSFEYWIRNHFYYCRDWLVNYIWYRDAGFSVEWCSICESDFVRCPLCGNNSCNGGYGEVDKKECPMCEYVYDFQESLI